MIRFQTIRATLRNQIADPLSRSWATMLSGTVARLMLGLVASISIARGLGPTAFGSFATLGAVAGIGGAIFDFGLSAAAVRRVAAIWPTDQAVARRRAFVFIRLRLILATALTPISIILAGPLAAILPGHPEPLLVFLALLGVIATSLSGMFSALLQATGAFRSLALVLIVKTGHTPALALLLLATHQLTIITALGILGIGTSLVSLGLGWRWLPLRAILPGEPAPTAEQRDFAKAERQALLQFGTWVWVANGLSMLATSLDLLLVGRWLPQATVGQYALGSNLAAKADIVNQSLHAAMLPAATQIADQQAARRYLRRGIIRSALISALLLPMLLLAGPLITLFYGAAFAPATIAFQLLLGVAIVEIWLTPLLLLAYANDRPIVLAGADAVRVTTLAGSGAWLIPLLGLPGAPLARLCARLVGALVVAIALIQWQSREPAGQATDHSPN